MFMPSYCSCTIPGYTVLPAVHTRGAIYFQTFKKRIQYSIPPKPKSNCKTSMFIQYMSLTQVSEKGIMPCLLSEQPEVRHCFGRSDTQ